MDSLERAPSNQRILITQDHLSFLGARFEREVIDPMWFGQQKRLKTDADIKEWGQGMELARARFDKALADTFEISIEVEFSSNCKEN